MLNIEIKKNFVRYWNFLKFQSKEENIILIHILTVVNIDF